MPKADRAGARVGRAWPWAVAAAALLAFTPAADAHAERLDSSPAKGATLDHAPAEVWVLLSEEVDPASVDLEVRDAARARWDLGDLRLDQGSHPRLTVAMRPGAPNGTYIVYWSALSTVDGHGNSGTFGFSVGPYAPPETHDRDPWPVPPAAARAVSYAGLALGLGGAALLAVLRPTAFDAALARRGLAAGSLVHLAGALLLLWATWDASRLAWPTFAGGEVGRQLAARVGLGFAAAAFAVAALRPRPAAFSWIAAAALAGCAAFSARLGHLSAHGWPAVAVDAAHLVAAATWVGGLALLLAWMVMRRPGEEELRAAGLRFGSLALACVAVAGATGVASASAIAGRSLLDPAALVGTRWGAVLATKVALTAGMVALAGASRYRYLASAGPPGRPAARTGWPAGLRRTVLAEAATGAAVLVLAGLLASLSPGP